MIYFLIYLLLLALTSLLFVVVNLIFYRLRVKGDGSKKIITVIGALFILSIVTTISFLAVVP